MRRKIAFVMLAALVGAVASGALWVRLAPVDAERWHVDPLSADPPGSNGWLVRDGGDEPPSRFDAPALEVLRRLDGIATAEPRTRRVTGSVDEGRITYETRSRLWGFPDYTTIAVTEDLGGAAPVVLARARYGASDLGVNRARVDRWLSELRQELAGG